MNRFASLFNLFLALIWLAVALFLYLEVDRGQPPGQGLPVPLSGVAFLLVLYNLARWWMVRTALAQRRAAEGPEHRHRPLRRPGDDAEPDPAFDFSNPRPADPSHPGPERAPGEQERQ